MLSFERKKLALLSLETYEKETFDTLFSSLLLGVNIGVDVKRAGVKNRGLDGVAEKFLFSLSFWAVTSHLDNFLYLKDSSLSQTS